MKYKWLQNNTKLPAIQIQFLPLFTLISVRIFYVICVTHCEKPNIYIYVGWYVILFYDEKQLMVKRIGKGRKA